MRPAIIVHGGAGNWELDSQWLREAVSACRQAAEYGQGILMEGGDAMQAIEGAVRILEDSPVLDAGRGSFTNAHGEIEMDAMIMDGRTLQLGAIAAIQNVRYPISLARRVLNDGRHNFLVGTGADAFATEIGFPRCEFADLLVPNGDGSQQVEASLGDTVGAVAIDQDGNVAAATSTGGTAGKYPGRVGDSPLVGSGAYADNDSAAVSATGHGEDLMRIVISKQVCDYVAGGMSAQRACAAAIELLSDRVQGEGGLIAVDWQAGIGFAFNTRAMPYAYAQGSADTVSGS